MAGRMSRNKGQRGEREIIELIRMATGITMKRNLNQVRNGGHDLIGIDGIAIEVKRQEKLAINSWWSQTEKQAKVTNAIPILAYRQSKKKWVFLLGDKNTVLDTNQFLNWLKTNLKTVTNTP